MEYRKDFDGWNIKKKVVDRMSTDHFVQEGEIWWCSIGINIGVEIDGKNDFFERPVLILKKINLESAWVVPLVSNFKESVYIYRLNTFDSCVSISQMKCISVKRLSRRVMRISLEEYSRIIIRIKYILTPQNETPSNHEGGTGNLGAI